MGVCLPVLEEGAGLVVDGGAQGRVGEKSGDQQFWNEREVVNEGEAEEEGGKPGGRDRDELSGDNLRGRDKLRGRDEPSGDKLRGRDKPSPYGFGEFGLDEFVLEGGGGRFRVNLDGEGDFIFAAQDLGDPVDQVLHMPIFGKQKNQIPTHGGAVFAQEKDEVDVAVVAGIQGFVVPEMQAEVQEGDFGRETLELQTCAVLVGLGGAPDVV